MSAEPAVPRPAHRNAVLVLFVALTLLAPVVFGTSAAQAKQARLFAGSFGEASNPAPFPANPYPLAHSGNNVAVDQFTHDVYVSDSTNHRIEKFDSAGDFLFMFGREVNKTAVEEARPQAEQNLCPAPGHPADVCQEGKSTGLHSPLEEPFFLAVDNSIGPLQGDIYVSNGASATAGLIDKFDASGDSITGWASAGQLDGSTVTDPPAPIAGPFGRIGDVRGSAGGIAVDSEGHLWVATANTKVFEFSQDAKFVTGFSGPRGEPALDSAGNLYFNEGGSTIKYDSAGKQIGQVAPSEGEITRNIGGVVEALSVFGLAVDPPSGDLYLEGHEGPASDRVGVVKRYDSSCKPVKTEFSPQPGCEAVEAFGVGLLSGFPGGIAIDSASTAKPLYLADEAHVAIFSLQTVPDVVTTKPANPTHTSATLTGTVNPSGVELNPGTEGCRFEWGETTAYGNTAPCNKSAAEIGTGNSPVEVKAPISGLAAGKTYHYRLVASNPNDENATVHQPSFGQDLAFGPPLIESTSAIDVTATSATLPVQVNPNDVDTHLRVEYVSQGQFEAEGFSEPSSTPQIDIGSAGTGQLVTLHLQGLVPATAYRYRAVAESILAEGAEAAIGAEQVLTTQGTGAATLLDARQWELVSPPNKLGASLAPIGAEGGMVQASPSGNSITYGANAPTEPMPPGNSETRTQVLSAHGGSTWASRDISTPHVGPTGLPVGPGSEVRFFSTDLSSVLVQPFGQLNPELSSEASEQTPFLRTNYLGGVPTAFCALSCYRPLVTAANVPPGTEFATECAVPNHPCRPEVVAASPDASHFVLESAAALVEGAPAFSLYEWSEGALRLVSLLPGDTAAPTNSSPGLGDANTTPIARNAISSDGSRIVWSEGSGSASHHHLYLRDMSREETLQLDALKGGSGKGTAEPRFQSANPDGSAIFFTDGRHLTPGSGASKEKPDLYECEITEGEGGELACELTDLTPENGGESGGALGVPGTSDDGSYVYFIANGVLTGAEENEHHEKAEPGSCNTSSTGPSATCNLYLRHGGTTRFIAALSGRDEPDWATASNGNTNLAEMTARVSPDGLHLALMSQRSLTGHDNRDAVNGTADQEVFLYDAEPEAGRQALVCASCNPTGARPHGTPYKQLGELAFARILGFERDGEPTTIAANVPGWTSYLEIGNAPHQSRYLSNSGRLFFNSQDALVPRDSNGTGDVYEYEPSGVGDCTEASPSYAKANGGCISLISSGTSKDESAFLDASESGDGVFFLTHSQLVKRDIDTALDVYDARVNGGEAEEAQPPNCEGDGCQLPATPPNDATPGSLTFHGAGNVREETKKKTRHKKKHVKEHKRKAHKKNKRAAGRKHGGAK